MTIMQEPLPQLSLEDAVGLQIGDQVDLRDTVGRFLPATIIAVFPDSNVKLFSFDGWSRKYDTQFDVTGKLHDLAPLHSRSRHITNRLPQLVAGSNIDVLHEGDWYVGVIKKLHIHRSTGATVSSQVQVYFPSWRQNRRILRWFDKRDPTTTRDVTAQRAQEFKLWLALKKHTDGRLTAVSCEVFEQNLRIMLHTEHANWDVDKALLGERSHMIKMLMQGDPTNKIIELTLKSGIATNVIAFFLLTGRLHHMAIPTLPFIYLNASYLQCGEVLAQITQRVIEIPACIHDIETLMRMCYSLNNIALVEAMLSRVTEKWFAALAVTLKLALEYKCKRVEAKVTDMILCCSAKQVFTNIADTGPNFLTVWPLVVKHDIKVLHTFFIQHVASLNTELRFTDHRVIFNSLLKHCHKPEFRPIFDTLIFSVYLSSSWLCPYKSKTNPILREDLVPLLELVVTTYSPQTVSTVVEGLKQALRSWDFLPALVAFAVRKPCDQVIGVLTDPTFEFKKAFTECCFDGQDWSPQTCPVDVLQKIVTGRKVNSDWGKIVTIWLNNTPNARDRARYSKLVWNKMVVGFTEEELAEMGSEPSGSPKKV